MDELAHELLRSMLDRLSTTDGPFWDEEDKSSWDTLGPVGELEVQVTQHPDGTVTAAGGSDVLLAIAILSEAAIAAVQEHAPSVSRAEVIFDLRARVADLLG